VRTDRLTLAAFLVAVVIAGLNFVAVRFSNREVPPFEGAAIRFAAASLLFFAYTRARGIPLPRGRSLVGAVLFGLLGFCGAYAFVYWGLVAAPAGTASVTLALVPLITPLLATAHGLERLRARTFVGGAVAAAGIAIVVREQLAATVPLASLAALFAGALGAAESGVVVKYFPRSHPAATNAAAMACGSAALVAVSLVARESWVIPAQPATIVATAYLIASTVALFALVLYVLGRWTATAASLQFPLSPLVTVVAGALLAGEGVSLGFLAGAMLAAIGVLIAAGVLRPLGAGRTAVAPS
jgi:drug/metabolite transporter (DMT)-like permease